MIAHMPLSPAFLEAVRRRIAVSEKVDEIAARHGESVDDWDVAVPMLKRLLEGYEAQSAEIIRLKIEGRTRADTLRYIRQEIAEICKTLQVLAEHE